MKIERIYVPATPIVDRRQGLGIVTDRAVDFNPENKNQRQRQQYPQRETQDTKEEEIVPAGRSSPDHVDVIA